MKKLSLAMLIALMGCGMVACSDSDDDSKAANGESCSVSSDCESNYCGDDKKCADQPVVDDKKDNGADCEANADCKSDYCGDDKKCADQPVVDDKKADGEACAAHSECAGGYCLSGVCKVPAENDDCTPADDVCVGNSLYSCVVDAAGEDAASAHISVTDCGADVCVTEANGKKVNACLSMCDTENAVSNVCDGSDVDEDGGMRYSLELTCSKVGEKLVNVPTDRADCGLALCWEHTGTCEKEAENGADCTADNFCKSFYCDDATKKCADRAAENAACTRDAACASDLYCSADKKCTAKADDGTDCKEAKECKGGYCNDDKCASSAKPTLKANGEACTDALECQSSYCDGKVCADKPEEPKVACSGYDKKCGEGEICSADYVCKKSDKKGLLEACTIADDNTDDCDEGLKCRSNSRKCDLKQLVEKMDCKEASATCEGTVYVACIENASYGGSTFSYQAESCAKTGKTCMTANGKTGCYELCTTEGSTKTTCPDGGEESYEIQHTCTKLDDGQMVYMTKEVKCTGMETCFGDHCW